jgi:hypothetical protein
VRQALASVEHGYAVLLQFAEKLWEILILGGGFWCAAALQRLRDHRRFVR